MDYILNTTETGQLIKVIKDKFQNIYLILYILDPQESENFERRNEYFLEKHKSLHEKDHSHSDDHQGHGCCGKDSVKTKFYIPEKELTFKEKILYEMTQDYKMKTYLPDLLKFLSERFFNVKIKDGKVSEGWNDKQVFGNFYLEKIEF